ncbi:MAG: hypothetical protein LBS10_00915 [Gracilibacteraceae bacterium]|jgi:hypothetical protein|nr:hypothetical protein [Gracilibacteraceae bacterium]
MKRLKVISMTMAAVLTLLLGAWPLPAAEDGAWLAATNTYYLNPDTGETADGGTQNAAIGEGMCRSVVYKDALVEWENGRVFLTVRLLLLSNMRDVRLSVQQGPGGAYQSVAPRVIAEDAGADSADYRFEVPAQTGYISWEMYVEPMGRDVKFYMNVSDALREGSGDFVVTVRPQAAQTPAENEATAPAETTTAPAETTTAPAETTTAPAETTTAPAETTTAPAETTTAPAETTTAPAETSAPPVAILLAGGGALVLVAALVVRRAGRRGQ